MQTVVIVIHLMVIVSLIAVVLLQRSEGGALGIGGGGNSLMTARSQGNVLTRATTFLGIAFFATSIAMSVLARLDAPPSAILEAVSGQAGSPDAGAAPEPGITLQDLEALTGGSSDSSSQVPTTQ
jgi:preprotein translocase subunit SecG